MVTTADITKLRNDIGRLDDFMNGAAGAAIVTDAGSIATLQGLIGLSVGATAPAVTWPGRVWHDTSVSPAVLRVRNEANDGWIGLPLADVVAPSGGQAVAKGQLVRIPKADGSVRVYQAARSFTWAGLIAHAYAADPDIIPLRKPRPARGAVVPPTGYAPLPFTVWHAPGGVQTPHDRRDAFRAAFQPVPDEAHVWYIGPLATGAANGTSWIDAYTTIGAARTALNAAAGPGVTYVRSRGRMMGRNAGPSHSGGINFDHALIGVDDDVGRKTWLGNV